MVAQFAFLIIKNNSYLQSIGADMGLQWQSH